MAQKFSSWYHKSTERAASFLAGQMVRHRLVLLSVFLLLTVFLGWYALRIELEAGYEKSIPSNHPYMEVYHKHSRELGAANVLTIALMQREGEIFNPKFFRKLEQAVQDVLAIPGIDQSTVNSLFSPQALYVTVDELGYKGGRIIKSDFRPTSEDIEQVRQNLLKSAWIGTLVSPDFKGATILAELVEVDPKTGEALDYRKVGEALEALRAKYENGDVTVHIIGFSKFINDVIAGGAAVIGFFAITFVIMGILLYFYSASVSLTVAALFAALDAVIWELGLLHVLGYGIDPLSILVPFLVFSIGVSHAVQMINAWRTAVVQGADSVEAARIAFSQLFIPGTTALFTAAVGFAVIMVIDIPIIRELGVTASIGMAVMIITNKFLLPVLLSYLKPSDAALSKAQRRSRFLEDLQIWRMIARCAEPRAAAVVLLVTMAIMGYGIYERQFLIVGDTIAGAPELRPTSRYNQDVATVVGNFRVGIDEFTVVAEIPKEGCDQFVYMYPIDRLTWTLANHPSVEGVRSLAGEVRSRNASGTEGYPKYFEIPRDRFALGETMRQMELKQRFYNMACDAVPIRLYLPDHKAETLRAVTGAVENYIAEYGDDYPGVRFRMAIGSAAVMAATNDAVQEARHTMLFVLYLAVGLLCFLTFLSWRMTACVLIPLILVSQLAEAVMAWLGIGLKVSTLPVLALGAGVGVDYGIYLFARTQSALQRGLPLKEAYLEGLRGTGAPVVFTAITLTLGVATWVFSPLKFQADMGLLLAYMFFVNMLGAILILPALAAWLLREPGRRRDTGSEGARDLRAEPEVPPIGSHAEVASRRPVPGGHS